MCVLANQWPKPHCQGCLQHALGYETYGPDSETELGEVALRYCFQVWVRETQHEELRRVSGSNGPEKYGHQFRNRVAIVFRLPDSSVDSPSLSDSAFRARKR